MFSNGQIRMKTDPESVKEDMLNRQLEDQQVAPPTIFIYGAKSPLTNPFVLLAPFLDKKNSIIGV